MDASKGEPMPTGRGGAAPDRSEDCDSAAALSELDARILAEFRRRVQLARHDASEQATSAGLIWLGADTIRELLAVIDVLTRREVARSLVPVRGLGGERARQGCAGSR